MGTRTWLSASLVLAAVALPAAPARAARPGCGDVVTADVRLTADLTCPSSDGLVVRVPAAGSVTVDLGGHRLSGGGGMSVGVAVARDSPPASVVVRDGAVTDFGTAFDPGAFRQPTPNSLAVDRVRVQGNARWLAFGFRRATITNSALLDTGPGGVLAEGDLTIRTTLLARSPVISGGETDNTLSANLFVGSGFVHGPFSNLDATGNTFLGCQTGISIPDVFATAESVVRGNVFVSCATGLSATLLRGERLLVSGNRFLFSTGVGLRFDARAGSRARIEDNYVAGGGADGIAGTGVAGTVLAANMSVANSGHGIDVSGVTDGGGNTGVANRERPECVGVVCVPPR